MILNILKEGLLPEIPNNPWFTIYPVYFDRGFTVFKNTIKLTIMYKKIRFFYWKIEVSDLKNLKIVVNLPNITKIF